MGETALQLGPHTDLVADEIACLDQKIKEIETAVTKLQFFIGADRRLQRLMEKGGEVGIASRDKCVKVLLCPVTADEHLVTRERTESRALGALPAPASCACKIAQRRFEPIV